MADTEAPDAKKPRKTADIVEEVVLDEEEIVTDTYQASLDHEASEVARRSEEEDQNLFQETCQHIRDLLKEIQQLKADKPDEWQNEVEERRVQVLMLMLTLRRLSRVQKVRVRDARDKTVDARASVDGVTLQLQNLLYEVAHLKKEARRCLEFHSADQEIDLVSLQQFYQEAPESVSRPTETVEDEHQQRLARLQWELEQRRGQTELFEKLTQEKESVGNTINEQEQKLASLAPRIDTILESTKPLQEALQMPLDAKREQRRISRLLPSPLYTLWVQACAYGEACDSNLKVEILGDADAAKKLIQVAEDAKKVEQSDSENDQDQQEETTSRKKRATKKDKKVETNKTEGGVDQLLEAHPLSIKMMITTKEKSSVLLTFYYLQSLRIVTVKCLVNIQEKPKTMQSDVVSGDNLLNCLFPGDSGTSSPNPATLYQLNRARINVAELFKFSVTGRPYHWAQSLGGLSFSKPQQPIDSCIEEDSQDSSVMSKRSLIESVQWEVSAEHMHVTVKAIRNRLLSRLALQSQLINLESVTSTSSIALPAELLRQHFPGKISSELKSWRPMSWSDYKAAPSTQHLRTSGNVTAEHIIFKSKFERKHVVLDAFVAISPDHPNTPPLFSLNLQWEGHHHAENNPHIQQMEMEMNIHCEEMVSNRKDRLQLLPLLLHRLAMCLDIYTEATSAHADAHSQDAQFHKEKIFFRPARGPERAHPFKYLPKLGVFAQR